ncbi:MAG TPA: glycogen/starch synthase [Chthoniobacterales bacterium]
MKIIMASSELAPYAATGNLGSHVRTLAVELRRAGHDVSVVLPYYRSVREGSLPIQATGVEFQITLGGKRVMAEVLETKGEDGVQVFLVRKDEYFDRSAIYGDTRAYEDNSERFIFFSKSVLELARRLSPSPELIHSHDWTTALIPVFVKERQLPFQTILTVHDLEHQGSFWSFDFALTNLPGHYFGARGVEFYGRLNFLKAGILFADAVTLPGEPALHEALTPEGGHGLHIVLQENAARLQGIPLGNDYTLTNPDLHEYLEPGKRTGVSLKGAYRQAFVHQHQLSLDAHDLLVAVPLTPGDAAALAPVYPILDLLLPDRFRLAVLGTVPAGSRAQAIVAARRYPGRFLTLANEGTGTAQALALAAADLLLMPSSLGYRAQPLIAALRYGTLPVVRFRPGLIQLVTDVQPANQTGTGFLYYRDEPLAVWEALQRGKWLLEDQGSAEALRLRASALDFSWAQTAHAYGELYASLLRHRHAVSA